MGSLLQGRTLSRGRYFYNLPEMDCATCAYRQPGISPSWACPRCGCDPYVAPEFIRHLGLVRWRKQIIQEFKALEAPRETLWSHASNGYRWCKEFVFGKEERHPLD